MAGNVALGPLDENAATLGDSTRSPTMVMAGDALIMGFLVRIKRDLIYLF